MPGPMCILSILLLLSAMATASVATPAPSQSLGDVETTIHVDGFDRTYLNSSSAWHHLHKEAACSNDAARTWKFVAVYCARFRLDRESGHRRLHRCLSSDTTNRSGTSSGRIPPREFYPRLERSNKRLH